jgi:hypothetical protein
VAAIVNGLPKSHTSETGFKEAAIAAGMLKSSDKSSIFPCTLARFYCAVYCAVYNLDCFFGHTGSPGQNSERLFLGGKPV